MASTYMQGGSVNKTRFPVRATYTNLYKWPESDAEFVKRVGSNVRQGGREEHRLHPGVVDSLSCRQMYLRSYPFSRRKETVSEKIVKCLGGVKEKLGCGSSNNNNNRRRKSSNRSNSGERFSMRRFVVLRKPEEVSCASSLSSLLKTLLACTSKVDVAK